VGVDLTNFAESVGDQTAGPAWIIGQQTRVKAPTGVRQVQAPSGIYDLQPDEMTVVCGAGTSINELQEALGAVGQYVNLPLKSSDSGTVGGALAQGHGDIYRLGRGALRDTLLHCRVRRRSNGRSRVDRWTTNTGHSSDRSATGAST